MHHQTTGGCQDVSHVARLERNLMSLKLYPETVDVFSVPRFQTIGSGNGGWGDARDHELCMRVCARGQNATTFRRSDSEWNRRAQKIKTDDRFFFFFFAFPRAVSCAVIVFGRYPNGKRHRSSRRDPSWDAENYSSTVVPVALKFAYLFTRSSKKNTTRTFYETLSEQ